MTKTGLELMRLAAWERAKAELEIMLLTYNHETLPTGEEDRARIMSLRNKIEEFIKDVEHYKRISGGNL